ncbi:hypothetical protein AB5J62_05305 [Amycolatopsis sp. cg5]|uniref:hypothetical protein n=1 Tax=Amycolatopsis sp. cg5 TaxID=3238802 RepID=UPI003523227C
MSVTIARSAIEAIQSLLTEIPQADAPPRQRANYLVHKGEVYDLLAGLSDHEQYTQLRAIANSARYEARALAVQY